MYNQTYEDYMKSVLGYSFGNNCNNDMNTYSKEPMCNNSSNTTIVSPLISNSVSCNCNLKEMYPDIYYIINPMVCKICNENTRPITKELIEEMTDTIYDIIEVSDMPKMENRAKEQELKNGDVINPNVKITENRVFRPNNNGLRDLILILLLNQIGIGRPPYPGPTPPRPPYPGPGPILPPRPPYPGPGRPPIHGGPGRPQPRD